MSLKLIVIIRDVTPMIHFQDPAEHRMVEIELTPEQEAALTLQWRGVDRGHEIYEELATCFLQGDAPREPSRAPRRGF